MPSDFWMQWSYKEAYKETLLKLGGLFKNNFEVLVNHKIGKDDNLTEEILDILQTIAKLFDS